MEQPRDAELDQLLAAEPQGVAHAEGEQAGVGAVELGGGGPEAVDGELEQEVGAVGGLLVAPIVYLEPNMMSGVLLYGFAGALLGGVSSPGGAVLGGILVGVFENWLGGYVPGGGELKLTFALILITIMSITW